VRHATVLYNPTAGAGGALPAAERACRVLAERGVRAEPQPTTGPGSASTLARDAVGRTDLLVVAGGDGSVREALVGLEEAATQLPIAIVPCGNANVVARELGIPLTGDGAFELLASGTPRTVDVGVLGDEIFLAMVGLGWDARTTANLTALRGTRLGSWWYATWADSAYFACGIAALCTWPAARLRMHVDGEAAALPYRAALVANLPTYGKDWSMVPDALFDDGRLHYQARKRAGVPFVALQLLAGMLRRRAPHFVSDYGAGAHIVIEADRPVPVHVDGDFRGFETALELRIRPGAARFLAPAEPERFAEVRKSGGL